MRAYLAAIATLSFVSSGAAFAEKKQPVSGLELQQIQARDFEAPKSITFPAVMTVLQDAGYRIGSADKDTGLITGTASVQSHTTWLPFVGFGRSKKTPVVSAFIEDRGAGSRIRLNFVLAKTKTMMYGLGSSDEEPMTDPVIYQGAFEKIEKEIFIRQSLNAPAPAPIASAPTAAAAPTSAEAPAPAPAAATPAVSQPINPQPASKPASSPHG